MVSTFTWYIVTGSNTGSSYTGSSITANFKNLDATDNNATYSSYPITTGSNSFTVYLKGQFSGTFNSIDNTKFYKSSGSTGSGVAIMCGLNVAYATPTATSAGDAVVPTALPGSTNVNAPGTGSAPSYCPSGSALTSSSWIRLQLLTSTSASPGDIASQTFTLQWDES